MSLIHLQIFLAKSSCPQAAFYFLLPRVIFHFMKRLANGYSTIEPPTHTKRMPKSRPIRECVSNRIVRDPSTTDLD
jgi:hypothetical protein